MKSCALGSFSQVLSQPGTKKNITQKWNWESHQHTQITGCCFINNWDHPKSSSLWGLLSWLHSPLSCSNTDQHTSLGVSSFAGKQRDNTRCGTLEWRQWGGKAMTQIQSTSLQHCLDTIILEVSCPRKRTLMSCKTRLLPIFHRHFPHFMQATHPMHTQGVAAEANTHPDQFSSHSDCRHRWLCQPSTGAALGAA